MSLTFLIRGPSTYRIFFFKSFLRTRPTVIAMKTGIYAKRHQQNSNDLERWVEIMIDSIVMLDQDVYKLSAVQIMDVWMDR